MRYEIRLSDMEFYARHGCYDLERTVGNRFVVDLVLTVESERVAEDDDVTQTVSYLDVYESVARQMQVVQKTVERVAVNIIAALRAEFPQLTGVRCTVSKLAPPLGGKVGRVSVTITN